MTVKGYNSLVIEDVIEQLSNEGLQSDRRFTESFCRSRLQKGYGPIRIGYELKQRGIGDELCDKAIFGLEAVWDDLIESVYLKKYSSARSVTRADWAKRIRFLQHRGFSGEAIKGLFNRLGLGFV